MFDQTRLLVKVWEGAVSPDHASVPALRHETVASLNDHGVARAVVADVEIVLAELVANAIDQLPHETIDVAVELGDDVVWVRVRNRTTGARLSPPETWLAVDPLSHRGRGLHIVRSLTDGVWVDHRDGWTEVRCAVRLDPDRSPTRRPDR